MLTPQQEKYCKNRALEEMTQQDAYRGAYNAENMNYDSIAVEASRLERTPKIALRIKELRDEKTAEILKEKKWTRDNAYNELTWLIERAKNEIEETMSVSGSTANAIVNCVKELNNIYEVTSEETEAESDGFIEALNGQAGEVWTDEENSDIPV